MIDWIQLNWWNNSKERVAPQNVHWWPNNSMERQGMSLGSIVIITNPNIEKMGINKNHVFEKMALFIFKIMEKLF